MILNVENLRESRSIPHAPIDFTENEVEKCAWFIGKKTGLKQIFCFEIKY